jgi:4-diphosphocytidyl-2-C-methyl-D-erythritol kinase
MPTRVRSHAKINLGLGIGAPRPDGFHHLVTVYQTLEIHDIVTVRAEPAQSTSISIRSNDARVPTDERNTAWKMLCLVLERLEISAEIDLEIEKRLPIQGGLGAGSANAVAALVGIEQELRAANLSGPERLRLAAEVGSDVPLFLIGGTVLGVDRGQQVYPLPDLGPVWCVVALPEIGVATPQAFGDWDRLCAREGLTAEASTDKLKRLSHAYASAFAGREQAGSSGVVSLGDDRAGLQQSALVRTGITSWIENDFERVVFPQHPSLCEIKRVLVGPNSPGAALYAALSGSGSALFGLYQTRSDAEAAGGRLRAAGVEHRITQTLPRSEYWPKMLL